MKTPLFAKHWFMIIQALNNLVCLHKENTISIFIPLYV